MLQNLHYAANCIQIKKYEKTQPTLNISTSLNSNNRLSRSDNLLVPVFSTDIFQQVTKYWRKEEKSFLQYFQYTLVSLTSGVKLHIHMWNVVVPSYFFFFLQIWYFEIRISRSSSESSSDFEITKVGCSIQDVQEELQSISSDYSQITKTRLYNFDPLKPHFYIVKLGFTGLISAQKHRLWVLVRTASPRRF